VQPVEPHHRRQNRRNLHITLCPKRKLPHTRGDEWRVFKVPTRKSRSLFPLPVDCATVSSSASCFPCRSDQATAAPSADRLRPTATTLRTLDGTCAERTHPVSASHVPPLLSDRPKNSSWALHPLVGKTRPQSFAFVFALRFSATQSFAGIGISRSR
jgi:hypothetical protein